MDTDGLSCTKQHSLCLTNLPVNSNSVDFRVNDFTYFIAFQPNVTGMQFPVDLPHERKASLSRKGSLNTGRRTPDLYGGSGG